MEKISHFIDGKIFSDSKSRKGKVFNPATGEQIAEVELASKEIDVLHNLINFSYSEDDLILDANINVFEDLRDQSSGDKYEFLSSLNLDKQSLFQNNHGNLDFNSIAQYKVFETNKQNELLVNNFEWKSRNFINQFGFKGNILGLLKNSNYNAKNVKNYKSDGFQSELAGILGYYSELPLVKRNKNKLNKFMFKNLHLKLLNNIN